MDSARLSVSDGTVLDGSKECAVRCVAGLSPPSAEMRGGDGRKGRDGRGEVK